MAEKNLGQGPKLLDQVRSLMRTRRYSLRTEQSYCDWIRRYVKFHGMRSRKDLADGTLKVAALHPADFATERRFIGPHHPSVKIGASCG